MKNVPMVGVIGGSVASPEALETAEEVGQEIARKGAYLICGGLGGIMEAACRGASEASGYAIGLNVSLPYEAQGNPYTTEELDIEFHYFFMRKFWFLYLAKALVVFPGGFGTLDELMELSTLIQTGKIRKKVPVVIYGPDYWNKVLNFDYLVQAGTVSREDLNLFHFSDSVDDAYKFLTRELTKTHLKGRNF